MEIKEKIIVAADDLFMRLGIRSVTMDDVARELSMSKKTLYQYFDNKDSLVTAVVEEHLAKERDEFCKIADEAENAIEEMHRIAGCLRSHVSSTNPSTLHDLQKFHSNAWDLFLEFKNAFIRGHVQQNIEKGMREGYYREDIDPEIMATFRVEQVQMTFDARIFPPDHFDVGTVQMQLFDHFFNGLLTEEGKKLYQTFQQREAKSILT